MNLFSKEALNKTIKTIESHPVIFPSVISFASFVVSVIALLISYASMDPDDGPIREIIKKEAKFAMDHNVSEVLNLYADDAVVVRDYGVSLTNGADKPRGIIQEWSGKEKIRSRYEMIKEHAIFPHLTHFNIEVYFANHGSVARAISSTAGSMKWDSGAEQNISTKGGENWTFIKINGEWKISSVEFHAQKSQN